ncbi:MAG: hypothetical protein ACTSSH_02245 [Candidatus Heimdallarchaeota archaeon]
MSKMSKCPKCKSTQIFGPAPFRTIAGVVQVTVPKSGIFVTHAITKAYVCAKCGYIELFTDSKGLEKIRETLTQV